MKALLDTNILVDYLNGIDAIIWASAKRENALLVSRNIKDFPADSPGVRAPYRL